MMIAAVPWGGAAMSYARGTMTDISPAGAVRWRIVGLLAGSILLASGLLIWRIFPAWDLSIATWLRLDAGSPVAIFFGWLTIVGGAAVMTPLALAAAAALGWAGRLWAMIWLVVTVTSGRIAVEATKYLVDRPRPPASRHLVDVATASFPSSHSAGTALTILALLMIARCRWSMWIAGFAFVIAIGLSRIMLGVHWPSDILAGWGFGIFWVAACFSEKLLQGGVISPPRPLRIRDRPPPDRHRES
jgi:undecaprenyl-diphosphatase